jgi:hypothetical protein
MQYLDVGPMMVALRSAPDEFELTGGWLHHTPSRHSFRFGPHDSIEIRAACDCALLAVRPEQRGELADGFRQWRAIYWRPVRINREFAQHFAPRSWWRRALIDLTGRLHRRLAKPRTASEGVVWGRRRTDLT